MTKRFGFTLAEVLITLGIIGVVAAMTIPSLLHSTGQQEFKTGFKKMISVLNQVITLNVAIDNSDFSTMTGVGTGTDSNSLYSMLNAKMSVTRTATDAAGIGAPSTGNYTMFFADGMAVSFSQTATSGTNKVTSCTTAAPCSILVDVNGTKKPNTLSLGTDTATLKVYDQFAVKLMDQQVVPGSPSGRLVMYN